MRPAPVSAALAALSLFSQLTPTQSTPCFAANDQNTNVSGAIYSWSMAGPNVNAWQLIPGTPVTAESIRIYTGNSFTGQVGEFMMLEIFDEDPTNPGAPNARLAGGTWETIPAITWQGANLDNPVPMAASTPYWVVFTEPGWSTPPTENGGMAFPSARLSGGNWQAAGTGALKFRIFCGLLDVQSAVSFGPACASAAGTTGTLFTNELPANGNADFRLEGSGFPGNALTFLVLGLVPNWPTFPIAGTNGCSQSVDTFASITGFTGTGDVRAATALGHVAFPLPLPSTPVVQGFYFSGQLGVFDPGSTFPIPFVTSNAMQVTVL